MLWLQWHNIARVTYISHKAFESPVQPGRVGPVVAVVTVSHVFPLVVDHTRHIDRSQIHLLELLLSLQHHHVQSHTVKTRDNALLVS